MEATLRPLARALARPRCHRRRLRSRAFTTSRRLPREIQDAYILSAARTPTGSFNGALASVPAPQLGAIAIRTAVERSKVPPNAITSVYMGNVLGAGMGQAPARQALIRSGVLASSVEATTINKVCSSGLKAVAVASQQIALGHESALVAGGMENMSQVPYYLPRGTQFPPFGELRVKDGMISDGLWDPYNDIHMGSCAEATVKKHEISREAQDEFAIESYKRATSAWQNGAFDDEVVSVTLPAKKKGAEETVVREDEQYKKIKLDKIPTLKPAFEKNGSITAASSSSFTDGASALVVANKDIARSSDASTLRVFAKIVSTADAALDPIDFPAAPAKAVEGALRSAGLSVGDISVWEINEAFAAVVIANAKMLGLDSSEGMQKINPLGGAIALGHAIGSSGSRILTTLLHQLAPGQFGCAAICNGGGGSTAMIVQRIDHV